MKWLWSKKFINGPLITTLLAHSLHRPLLPPPRRPLTGPTPPKYDSRLKRRTTFPKPYLPLICSVWLTSSPTSYYCISFTSSFPRYHQRRDFYTIRFCCKIVENILCVCLTNVGGKCSRDTPQTFLKVVLVDRHVSKIPTALTLIVYVSRL